MRMVEFDNQMICRLLVPSKKCPTCGHSVLATKYGLNIEKPEHENLKLAPVQPRHDHEPTEHKKTTKFNRILNKNEKHKKIYYCFECPR